MARIFRRAVGSISFFCLAAPAAGAEPPAPPRECGPDPEGSTLECRDSPCP